jgi:hypothetical protein
VNTNRDEATESTFGEPSCAKSETALASYLGLRRKASAKAPDEKGADWIVVPLFSTYRLGFFPVAGRYAVRRLEGGRA